MSKFDILDRMSEETIQQQEDVNPKSTEECPTQESAQPVTLEAVAQEVEPLLLAITTLTTTVTQQIKEATDQCRKAEDASIRFLHKMGGSLSDARNMAEEAKSAAQAAMNEAQESYKAAIQASGSLQEQAQKIRLTAEATRWAYPLITAVLVSLLWAALLLWQMPDYEKMTTWQGQIWQKLETMSATQDAARKEAVSPQKR